MVILKPLTRLSRKGMGRLLLPSEVLTMISLSSQIDLYFAKLT
jgi:hypothetical protein